MRILLLPIAVLAALLPAAWGDGPGDAPDPVPLQRVKLDPKQLPLEMERLKKGILTQLPRSEFEARVRQAARGAA